MTDQDYMQLAIDKAREGIAAGQSPFGAVVVRDGQVVSADHNTVWLTCDPTAHAEVNAIRSAAKKLLGHGLQKKLLGHGLPTVPQLWLSDCVMFTTCEPCPMCLTAIHWAKIKRCVFGATIADAAAAGFSELHLPAKDLARQGGSPLIVEDGVLRTECSRLFTEWREAGKCQAY